MQNVYCVPGFAGTTLGSSPATPDDTWVSYSALAVGLIGRMRLAPDGVSPGPPDGVQLYPGYMLPSYYGSMIARLTTDLNPQGYTIVPWPYDWRLSAQTSGAALAAAIEAQPAANGPATIVAHSFGGLVARIAWATLAAAGKSALVRRLITLGTPHWGSYEIVRTWSNDSTTIDQLFLLCNAAYVALSQQLPVNPLRLWTAATLAALIASWKSAYETLPSLLDPQASSDPYRSLIYTDGWPAELGISQALLQYAYQTWQPLMQAAASVPPSGVFTTVAGNGIPTAYKLTQPKLLGTSGAYALNGGGEGVVEVSSAALPGSAIAYVNANHAALPAATAASGLLTALILDPRSGSGPPPAPVPAGALYGSWVYGPPVATDLQWGGMKGGALMAGGC